MCRWFEGWKYRCGGCWRLYGILKLGVGMGYLRSDWIGILIGQASCGILAYHLGNLHSLLSDILRLHRMKNRGQWTSKIQDPYWRI